MVQDKELSTPKEKRSLRKLLWAGKLLVTLLILSYIYNTFRNEQKGIADVAHVFSKILIPANWLKLTCMVLLVPVNWALESLKWKQLAQRVVVLSFWDAFRGILTGLAIGVAAPAQLGDTVGRIAVLKSDNRLKAIGAALVSNGIQFYVSVLAGAIGWIVTRKQLPISNSAANLLDLLLGLTVLIGVVLMVSRKKLVYWHPSNKYLQKIQSYLHIVGVYTTSDLLKATTYGTLRYLVFLTQFILAISFFDFPLDYFELASCVSLVFLAKTLIPAVNVIGDLGLREFTALFVFKQYNLPAEEIITATFLIWAINVLGPILVGIVLVWKYKFKSIINIQP
ncbi:lysylphosphatidylglycerol synthase domain-containing protein [Dyadobacter psychrotolerans]|uniref:Flippase-like domain-containing protein n=1 Tax=Dyadobacter psychrotolerans TaxID=2541721 RepID=A0A4R5DVR6_9BACT|nr:lysylphosphatidylglycerol synthase domain-containing protein [Dyadobacter psychrotolerans]TDE15335.1 flippase-like domain-containing protein [Dyadobacter psychrotolerans]